MSAPTGEDTEIPEAEAIERIQSMPAEWGDDTDITLRESDRELHAVAYTGGDTDYAHIYLAYVTGQYNGNQMLWVRYVWLSKPGAYENDMWGENGMSMRMVDGMADSVIKSTLAACNALKNGGRDGEPRYVDAREEA